MHIIDNENTHLANIEFYDYCSSDNIFAQLIDLNYALSCSILYCIVLTF